MPSTTTPFCSITIGGKTVLDPPHGFAKPTNFFRMTTGAARYGRGSFLLSQDDYDSLTEDLGSGAGGGTTLVMKDGTNTLSLPVIIGGAVPAVTSVDDSPDVVEVYVFDLRCNMVSPVTGNFNVIQQPYYYGAHGTDESDWDYWPSTLDGTDVYSWSGIASELELPTIPAAPTWTPRNIEFDAVPLADAADQFAAELFLVVGFDWTAGTINFNSPGTTNAGNSALLTTLLGSKYKIGSGQWDHPKWRGPKNIICIFRAITAETNDPYAQSSHIHSVPTSTGTGQDQALHVGNQPVFWLNDATDGNEAWNALELNTLAVDLAARCFAFMSTPSASYEFAGIQLFQPDGGIREITWISDHAGPRTRIAFHNGRDFRQFSAEEERTMEIPGNELTSGIGETCTAVSPSGQRQIWKKDDEEFVQITDTYGGKSVGGGTGQGRYKGIIVHGRGIGIAPTSNFAGFGSAQEDNLSTGVTIQQCVAVNLFEYLGGAAGAAAGGVHLTSVGQPVLARYGGQDNDDPTLPVFYFTNGPIGTWVWVALNQVGGSAGDTTHKASWTYDILSIAATPFPLGFALVLEDPVDGRPFGNIAPATKGAICLDATGKIILVFAREIPVTGTCVTPS